MAIVVTITGPPLEDLPITGEALMRELGLLAVRRIRTRTERQVDVHGRPFRALSAGYAKAKAAAGLAPIPDLTVSGRLLNDMQLTEVTERTATISFISAGGSVPNVGGRGKRSATTANTFIQRSRNVGAADKAFFHHESGAGRSQVKREFFGLSTADEDALVQALDRYLERVLE